MLKKYHIAQIFLQSWRHFFTFEVLLLSWAKRISSVAFLRDSCLTVDWWMLSMPRILSKKSQTLMKCQRKQSRIGQMQQQMSPHKHPKYSCQKKISKNYNHSQFSEWILFGSLELYQKQTKIFLLAYQNSLGVWQGFKYWMETLKFLLIVRNVA